MILYLTKLVLVSIAIAIAPIVPISIAAMSGFDFDENNSAIAMMPWMLFWSVPAAGIVFVFGLAWGAWR